MTTSEPLRKRGRKVLWLAIFCVFAAIGITLLMANDMRNLKALLRHYEIDWPILERSVPVANKRPAKSRRLPARPFELPAYFFNTGNPAYIGAFQRQVYIRGPSLCGLLDAAGIRNAGWQPSPYDTSSFECLSERRTGDPDDPAASGSFFFTMKGTPEGVIGIMRMKVILPGGADGDAIKADLTLATRALIDKTHWTDFLPVIDSIARLEDFTVSNFGADLTFKREFSDRRGYNLIFNLTGKGAELRRTRAYFEPARWLPLPREVISDPEEFF